jgi:hypothetical protein
MLFPSIRVAEARDVAGIEIVAALHFEYDKDLVALVKTALRRARYRNEDYGPGWVRAGGWSPRRRFWWVDPVAWPSVRRQLLEKGVHVLGPNELMEPPKPPKPKPHLPSLFEDCRVRHRNRRKP